MPARQRLGAIEEADVIEAEKSAGEDVSSLNVLAIHPPSEIEQQLLETTFKEEQVTRALASGNLVNAPAGPRVHGRIHIAKRPFVSGDLPVGMHVPFAQKEKEL